MYVSVCVFERDTQGEQGEGKEKKEYIKQDSNIDEGQPKNWNTY